MKLSQLIRTYQEKTGFNNATIAKTFGVSKATVGRWLSGDIEKVQEETSERISKILGVNVTKLLNNDYPIFKKPILGMAKAGYDLLLENEWLGEEALTYEDYSKGDFFLKVTGDSMIGEGIKDGALVYVKKTDSVPNGKIAVIQIGDEVTIKKIIYQNETMILEAANPTVANRYFTKRDIIDLPVKIIGQVIYAKVVF